MLKAIEKKNEMHRRFTWINELIALVFNMNPVEKSLSLDIYPNHIVFNEFLEMTLVIRSKGRNIRKIKNFHYNL